MKKIYFLLLILISTSAFSQKFEFDLATHYEFYYRKGKYETVSYSNTNNPNLFLYFYSNDGQRTAKLVDTENMQNHFFLVTSQKKSDGDVLHFKYLNSEKKEFSKYYKHLPIYYDFETTKTDSLSKTVILNFYTNEKRKKVKYCFELKVVPADANYFPNYRSTLHGLSERKELNSNENGLVVEAFYLTKKKKKAQAKLLYSEKIQLELIVE